MSYQTSPVLRRMCILAVLVAVLTFTLGAVNYTPASAAGPLTISISTASNTLSKKDGQSTTITVTASQAVSSDLVVHLTYTGAESEVDFSDGQFGLGEVVISDGEIKGDITISALPSTGTKTLTVAIDEASIDPPVSVGSPAFVTINLVDNNQKPSVSIENTQPQTSISENGGTSAFRVSLSSAWTSPVTVTLGYTTGTATLNTDFTVDLANATTLTIPVGVTNVDVKLTAVADDIREPAETAIVVITGVTGGTINNNKASSSVTINDANQDGTVSISASPVTISETGGTSTITVTSSIAYSVPVTVNLGYSGATQGTDFNGPAQLIIPAGQKTVTGTLTGVDNKHYNPTLTVTVSITQVSSGTISSPSSVNIDIEDATAGSLVINTGNYQTLPVTENPVASIPVKVHLAFAPGSSKTVTITITTSNPNESKVTPASLTFTSSDWDKDQTITVQGKDNGKCDGLLNYTIDLKTSSTDNRYNNVTKSIPATNSEYCSYIPLVGNRAGGYTDSFNGSHTWTMMPEANASVAQANNELVVKHINPMRNVRVLAPDSIVALGGFRTSVNVYKVGSGNTEYGILLDYKEAVVNFPVYYRFLVNPVDKTFRFERIDCSSVCTKVVLASGTSSAILADANGKNNLQVDWNGSTIQLYINKTLVATAGGYTYSGGRWGLMIFSVSNTSATLPAEAHFSTFAVSNQ